MQWNLFSACNYEALEVYGQKMAAQKSSSVHVTLTSKYGVSWVWALHTPVSLRLTEVCSCPTASDDAVSVALVDWSIRKYQRCASFCHQRNINTCVFPVFLSSPPPPSQRVERETSIQVCLSVRLSVRLSISRHLVRRIPATILDGIWWNPGYNTSRKSTRTGMHIGHINQSQVGPSATWAISLVRRI